MIEYIPLIYWIGYGILFISILLVGSIALAKDTENEKDVFNLLISLIIYPFFSWLLIIVMLLIAVFIWITEPRDG